MGHGTRFLVAHGHLQEAHAGLPTGRQQRYSSHSSQLLSFFGKISVRVSDTHIQTDGRTKGKRTDSVVAQKHRICDGGLNKIIYIPVGLFAKILRV